MPLISPIDHLIASLWSYITLTSNSTLVWLKFEAMIIERVSDGLKNTYLSVSDIGFCRDHGPRFSARASD